MTHSQKILEQLREGMKEGDIQECKLPACTNPARGNQEGIDRYSSKFCSDQCEVKYDHLKQDARDAQRAAEHLDPEEPDHD